MPTLNRCADITLLQDNNVVEWGGSSIGATKDDDFVTNMRHAVAAARGWHVSIYLHNCCTDVLVHSG